jgi:hypothetical protein
VVANFKSLVAGSLGDSACVDDFIDYFYMAVYLGLPLVVIIALLVDKMMAPSGSVAESQNLL